MPIFLRTPNTHSDLRDQFVAKGQIYNLDYDQFICFQFNPTFFEWSQLFSWNAVTFRGSRRGGSLQYSHEGARTMQMDLLFMADPASPDLVYDTPIYLGGAGLKVDYDRIVELFDRWQTPIQGKNRPSRLKVIVGPRAFNVVITELTHRVTEFFPDLSAREGLLSLTMREWVLPTDRLTPRTVTT